MPGSGRKEKMRQAKNLSWEENKAEARSKREFYESKRMIPTVLQEWAPPFYLPYTDEHGMRVEVEYNRDERELIAGAPMVEGTVYCREYKHKDAGPMWTVRISLWGNDDTFLGKWRDFRNQEDAMEQYHRWVTWMNNLAVAQFFELQDFGFNMD